MTPSVAFAAHIGLAGLSLRRPTSNSSGLNTSATSYKMQSSKMSTKPIKGISEIASLYKALLLDQFGVIHDGQRAYPCAVQALQELQKAGIKIIIISNSSRLASTTYRNLKRFDIDTSSISGVVTSGEIALTSLRAFAASNPTARVLHFNWGASSRNAISLADHHLNTVAPCSQLENGIAVPASCDVDVIVAHGIDGLTRSDGSVTDIEWDFAIQLVRRLAREAPHIPFYCANPDIVTVDGAALRSMPGALARAFEEGGGTTVHRLGKPCQIAYAEALKLGNVAPEEVLAVGDSLGHDILGAVDAGIDSLLIAGGIHAHSFGVDPGDGFNDNFETDILKWDDHVLKTVLKDEGVDLKEKRPTFVSSFFRW